MNQIYVDSIAKAKGHYEGNKDVLHDLSHSKRVAENAKLIARSLDYKDPDFLELCAYWHDVARIEGKEPHEEAGAIMARDDLLNRGADQNLSNMAYEAIRFHKSTASPVTIEGKIIRDADKLDVFFTVRWEKCIRAGWNDYYADELKKTMDNLSKYPGIFAHEFTRKLYAARLPKFLEFSKAVKPSSEKILNKSSIS